MVSYSRHTRAPVGVWHMTALCGGGTSHTRPAVSEVIVLGSGFAASLLNNAGRGWALIAAPIVGVIAYDALNACQADPPAEPDITADDVLALVSWSALLTHLDAIAKFRQMIVRLAWFASCQCDAPPQPTAPGPLPAPPNMPDLSGYYVPGPASICRHVDATAFSLNGMTGATPRFIPGNATCNLSGI